MKWVDKLGRNSRFGSKEVVQNLIHNRFNEKKAEDVDITSQEEGGNVEALNTQKNRVTKKNNVLYLVKGQSGGELLWHYVLINRKKEPLFIKALSTNEINVDLYGIVVLSGWGESPSEDEINKVMNEYV